MKRIQLQSLFFIFCFFLLASCKSLKPSIQKAENSYINTNKFKAMHHEHAYYVMKSQERRNSIPASFGGPMISAPENIDSYQDLLDDYFDLVAADGSYGYSGSGVLAHEMKCCDPNIPISQCDDDLCPCYSISADLQFILSSEPLLELKITDRLHGEIVAEAEIASGFKLHNIHRYSINLNQMIPKVLYIITFKVWDYEASEARVYTAHIAVD